MLWFFGGYILAAIAFYSYITATAKEEPEYNEQSAGLTTPMRTYVYASTDKDGRDRKAA